MQVIKRNGTFQEFDSNKIVIAISKAVEACCPDSIPMETIKVMVEDMHFWDGITIKEIESIIIETLIDWDYNDIAEKYVEYRGKRKAIREAVQQKFDFINNYKQSSNTANATVDDNANVASKNIGILNSEIHKEDNIHINRGMIVNKLRELYPEFDAKQYLEDLKNHIIYKHDENSFAGAISPYCCSISMYPFLLDGIKYIGGLSAAPKNLDSYCGMYINLIFATSAQFAGAVATSEFLLYFDYFARKEWGEEYYVKYDIIITNEHCCRTKTIKNQIHQYFQQVIYSINQPAAARGLQSAFVNFSLFDRSFFNGMFGEFYFPDGTQPKWESLAWLQKEFLHWFNQERLRCILTFPVVSCTLLYKDNKFVDGDFYEFICEEYAQGNSFFTYISDTVDSLSSCCRLKNKVQTKEFNFTNGNMGIMTGSKSVISLNLNRIVQNWTRIHSEDEDLTLQYKSLRLYLTEILERVYKYQTAYNELLWDMYDANLLPVYKSGFIDLNKQYLTIGLIGLTASAESMGLIVSDNEDYKRYCRFIFSIIRDQNTLHKTVKTTWNCEQVPAESAGLKLYNWDKQDGYKVPEDVNLYTSYVYKPNDSTISVLEKIRLHGAEYIGDYLDGGSSAHINLAEHLSKEQYRKVLSYAAENGCQYLTFNIPNSECEECGYITKVPITKCPKCNSENISLYDRIIGFLVRIKNWSEGRQIEQKTRVYSKNIN